MDNTSPTTGLGSEQPALVKHGDVMPFAKRGCSTCHGKGELTVVLGQSRTARACGCAVRRFLKHHRQDVKVLRKGELAWLDGKRPTSTQAGAP